MTERKSIPSGAKGVRRGPGVGTPGASVDLRGGRCDPRVRKGRGHAGLWRTS